MGKSHNPLNLISRSCTRGCLQARGAEDERRKCDQQAVTMMDPAAGSCMVFLCPARRTRTHLSLPLVTEPWQNGSAA